MRAMVRRRWRAEHPGRQLLLAAVIISSVWLGGQLTNDVASATVIDGRLSAIGYLHDPITTPAVPDPSEELDLISRLSLDIREIGSPAWSVYFFGAMRGEVLDPGLSGLKSHLYRGHVQFAPSRRLRVRAGRIFTSGGVASNLADGAELVLRGSYGYVVGFAGTRGWLNPEGYQFDNWSKSGWDQSGIASVYYKSPNIADQLALGVSWARTMWAGAEESERVGLLVDWRPTRALNLFYEHRHGLVQKVAYYQHLHLGYRFNTGNAALIWNRREGYHPAYENSYIFRRFESESWFYEAMGRVVNELRAHLFLQPRSWRGWRVSLDLVELFPENQERGDGLDVWVGKGVLRLGYRGLRGYRGLQDGFYGDVSWRVDPRTRLWFELNRISYRYIYEGLPVDDTERHATVASRLGAEYDAGSGWWLSLIGEALDYPGVNYDLRLLARVVYRFHVGTATGEAHR